jgi:cation:H+ antiporter
MRAGNAAYSRAFASITNPTSPKFQQYAINLNPRGFNMLLSIGLVFLGLILLVLGGEALLRGAVGLATLAKLTPAVIGLTVVAAGTSVPELAVSAIAAYQGKSDIAVANVVGSNIFNITVILGLCALVLPTPITGNTIKLEYPVLALVTLLCLVLARDGVFERLDALLCLAIYIVFTAYMVRLVRYQMTRSENEEMNEQVAELTLESKNPRAWVSILLLLLGIILLACGAHATVTGAVDLARLLGLSERVIGLTIVSAGTGLPEVVASLVSSVRGRSDIAIGNVIGSNLFNILGILGLSALASPLPVQAELIANDCWWMLGVTLILFPILFTGLRISRIEGALLVSIYLVYLLILLKSPSVSALIPNEHLLKFVDVGLDAVP